MTRLYILSVLLFAVACMANIDIHTLSTPIIEDVGAAVTTSALESATSSRFNQILELAKESPEAAIALARSSRDVVSSQIDYLTTQGFTFGDSQKFIEHDFAHDGPNTKYSVRRMTICGPHGDGDEHTHEHGEAYVIHNKEIGYIEVSHSTPGAMRVLSQAANMFEVEDSAVGELDGISINGVAVLAEVSPAAASTTTSSAALTEASVCPLPSPEADVYGVSPMRTTQRLRLRGRKVIVYLVKFSGETDYPMTVAEMTTQMQLVDEFWRNMTDDELYLSGYDIIEVPFDQPATAYTQGENLNALRNQLTDDIIQYVNNDNALSNNGEYDGDDAKYKHRIVVCNDVWASGWAGIAQTPGNNVWAKSMYIFRVFAHELGHNFGLGHANVIRSDTKANEYVDKALKQYTGEGGEDSAYYEYSDDLDTMSGSFSNPTYSFSASQLHYLRILDHTHIANAAVLSYASANTVIYNIAAIDDPRTRAYLRTHDPAWYYTYAAIHIPLTNTCNDAGLWLEYRGNLYNSGPSSTEKLYGQYGSNVALHGYIRFDSAERALNHMVSAVELNTNLRDNQGLDGILENGNIRQFETVIQPGDTWTCPANICSGSLRVTVVGASTPASGSVPGMMAVRIHSGPAEVDSNGNPVTPPAAVSEEIKVMGWVPAYPTEEVDIAASSLSISAVNPASTYLYLSAPTDSGLDGDGWRELEVSPKLKKTFSTGFYSYLGAVSPDATPFWQNKAGLAQKAAIRHAGGNLMILEKSAAGTSPLAFSVINRGTGSHTKYDFSVPASSAGSGGATLNSVRVNVNSTGHGLATEEFVFSSSLNNSVQDEFKKLSSGPTIALTGAAGGLRSVSSVNRSGTMYTSETYQARMDWVHPAYTIQPDYTSSDKVVVTPLFPPKGRTLYRTLPMNMESPPSHSFGDLTNVVSSDGVEAQLEFLAASPAKNKWHKSCVFAPYVPSGNTILDFDWAIHAASADKIPRAAVVSFQRWPTDNEFDPSGSLSFELFRSAPRSIYTTGARVSSLSSTASSAIEAKYNRYFSSRLNMFDWVTKDSAQSWNYICISVYDAPGEHMSITSPRIYELTDVVVDMNTDISVSDTVPTTNVDPVDKSSNAFSITPGTDLTAQVCGQTLSYPLDDNADGFETEFCALGLSESAGCPFSISVSPTSAVNSSIIMKWGSQLMGTRPSSSVTNLPAATGAADSPVTADASSGLSNVDPGSAAAVEAPLSVSIQQSALVVLGGSFVGYLIVVVLFWWLIRECIISIFGCMLKDDSDAPNPVIMAVKKSSSSGSQRR